MNLTTDAKIVRVSNAAVGGTTDINSAVVDMQGFESVTFLVAFGTITASAVTTIKAQQGALSDLSDAADLVGTSVTVADDDDDKVVALEIVNPRERYVRCVVDRGTANAVLDSIVAIQTGPGLMPTTHDATTVVDSEVHVSPAEGTA